MRATGAARENEQPSQVHEGDHEESCDFENYFAPEDDLATRLDRLGL